jgi:hypothetical protein
LKKSPAKLAGPSRQPRTFRARRTTTASGFRRGRTGEAVASLVESPRRFRPRQSRQS